jgi:hypothetical protein
LYKPQNKQVFENLECDDTKKGKQQIHSSEVNSETACFMELLSFIHLIKASSACSEKPANGPCPESDKANLHSINA